MDFCIIPECYIETNLIETLIPPNRQYNHQKGCGTVAKVMQEKFADRFALGIIDKDKRDIDYLNEFDCIRELTGILLHKHRTKPHYIIQINPAMEQFILSNAELANISLRDYNLPSEIHELKKVSKTVTSKNDIRFKRLFKEIVRNNESEFGQLQEWIELLKENPYGSQF